MSDDAPSDLELLDRHARAGDEAAFAELVRRHVNLVHSAALRQVRSPHLAEEVAQSVFADLARSARRLPTGTVLPAWLWQVARRTAVDAVRREARRRKREQAAHELSTMNAPEPADWTRIGPLLDEALQSLDETDRTVVLLRWFENKSLREIGAALGTSEDTAQKRAGRALDRLREFFTRRGVTVGAGGLAAALSANAVQAAPAGLAGVVIGGVLASGAVTTGWLATLLASFLTMINATKVTLVIVLLAAAAAIPAYRYLQPAHQAARPVVTAKAEAITPSGQAADRVAEPPPAAPEPAANTVDPVLLQAALENLLAQQQADALAAAVTTARTFVSTGSRTSFGTYKIDMGDYPTTAEGLQVLIRPLAGMADREPIRWRGPYIAVRRDTPDPLIDPWGNQYQYAYPGTHNPPSYDLWSMGPDGLSGTADDIGNWQP